MCPTLAANAGHREALAVFRPRGPVVEDLARLHRDALLEQARREREGRTAVRTGEERGAVEGVSAARRVFLQSLREAAARLRFRQPVL